MDNKYPLQELAKIKGMTASIRARLDYLLHWDSHSELCAATLSDDDCCERRQMLINTINHLNKPIDFSMMCSVLSYAKMEQAEIRWAGIQLDNDRDFLTQWIRTVRQLKTSLEDAKRLVWNNIKELESIEKSFEDILSDDMTLVPTHDELVQARKRYDLICDMLNDSMFKKEPPNPKDKRRDKAGHQPQSWLQKARRGLREAGITSREDRQEILVIFGLTYRLDV